MNFDYLKSNKGNTLKGPLLLKPKPKSDFRGSFYESWNKKVFDSIVEKDINFVQDNVSKSKKGVLRGLHYQNEPFSQAKLVRCISGEIFDIALDIRKSSNTFGQWAAEYLNEENKNQLWIPEGFAHGFLVISNYAEVLYKTNCLWNQSSERSIAWNDKTIDIIWPLDLTNKSSPITSKKDSCSPSFLEALGKGDLFK